MIEQWLSVVGFEGEYEVSNLGQVRSLDRRVYRSNGYTRLAKGRMLRTYADKKHPYPAVRLRQHLQRSIHKLVAEAFLGPCPVGHEVCHKNGVHADNAASNLYWGTRKQNMQDAIRHGVLTGYDKSGERNPRAKLSHEQVAQIKIRIAAGDKHTIIAPVYGVTPAQIGHIKHGRSWGQPDRSRAKDNM